MKYILTGFLCLIFIGCHQNTELNERLLAQAESLMESRPDSALAILQTVVKPHKLHEKAQADYCLLLTQAEYKNYRPFTSDSLLTIAINYYQSVDDKELLGKAYYYKGCFYNEQKNYIDAAKQYKQAETLLKQTDNNLMLALLYNAMGHLNRKSDLEEDALQQFKKALYYSERCGKVYHIAMDLQEVAKMYLRLNKPDSAGIYFARIVPYLPQCKEPKMATLFHNVGIYNEKYGSFDSAEKYILQSLELEKDTANRIGSYYALARIYHKQGHITTSDSLWNVVLNGMTDIRRKCGVYRRLFEQSVAEKEYVKAAFYADKQMLYMDSAYHASIAKEVAEVEKKYDNEILLRKSAEQSKTNIILWLVVLVTFIVGVATVYFIIYSQRKYRQRKEHELSSSIAKYQQELNEFKERHSESEEESEKFALLIKEKEAQIELLKQKKESSNVPEIQSAIIEGLDLYLVLKKNAHEKKLLRINVTQFKPFIAYYDKTKPEFMEALRKCGLTDYEIVICILFSIPFSHRQVCEVLCKSSETLSRVKLRLKDKIKKTDNREVTEQISSFVDLNL